MTLYDFLRALVKLPPVRGLKPLLRPNYKLKLLQRMPKSANCAEIGVWKGEFSKHIIEITRPKRLHLVDPWSYQPRYPHRMYGGTIAKRQNDMDEIFASVKQDFSSFENVRIFRMTSKEFFEGFDDKLDWIYIDGDHSAEAVLQDLNLSREIMRGRGIIAGDDYYWRDADGSYPIKLSVEKFCAEYGYKKKLLGDQFVITLH